jgi:hypothetical protein
MKKLFYNGLDVHRDTIVIAVARSGREPTTTDGRLGACAMRAFQRQLPAAGKDYPCRKSSRAVDVDRGLLELPLRAAPFQGDRSPRATGVAGRQIHCRESGGAATPAFYAIDPPGQEVSVGCDRGGTRAGRFCVGDCPRGKITGRVGVLGGGTSRPPTNSRHAVSNPRMSE